MKILSFDISTKTGWAYFEEARLVSFGTVRLGHPVLSYGEYPWCYDEASEAMTLQLWELMIRYTPDVLVIEETNKARARYTQKVLEFLHKSLLARLRGWRGKIIYLSSSTWRQALGLTMTKEDKKNNTKLAKAKRVASVTGAKLDKKVLGVRGKINKKHIALRYVNETYSLDLKVKDNDAADAICLCAAYLKGATPCDGVM